MFEIVLLIVAAGGIAAYARGRGGNPFVWGSLGVGGYIAIEYLGPAIIASLGRPLGCKNCKYLNQQYAVMCEACKQPYASKSVPLS
jgi:hypothetical protein